MAFLHAEHAISGKMGRAFALIDGQRHELFYLKDLEATIEKKKTEISVLGYSGTQHKAGGWSGKGSMTIYYHTSLFRRLMLEYTTTGKDLYFDIIVENEDPTAQVGRQETILRGVNLDSIVVAKLDVESEAMDESVSFTFNAIEMTEEFKS